MKYDNPMNIAAARERVLRAAENRGMLIAVPTKRQAKTAKKSYRALARESQPQCMLNMLRPAGHKLVPRVMDERTKMMFIAHEKRKETWTHG